MRNRRCAVDKRLRQLIRGDKRVIAQTITTVENATDPKVLEQIFPHTGKAYHIGITGPPGAGKSTLVNVLCQHLLTDGKKIGIIAVDPTSPFSGGALLGDRVRMTDLSLHKDVYIRSMGSRGSLGGLAQKTKDVALVLDAAGMDYVFIETIGVGQVELDIAQVCDTTVVVLVPESGDSIQAMKAGLLEIADILVVNKGDREGSDRFMLELKFAFELREQVTGWDFPILKTIATKPEGIPELGAAIAAHRSYLEGCGMLEKARKIKLKRRIHELIENRISSHLREHMIGEHELDTMLDKMYRRKLNPFRVAARIADRIIRPQ
ncbi:MAG: methylmalonyl Co-A mutase-associated GTPase MeaB [candidate division WOR-3 bacterium]|nr:MAG: methylmalonyl Co-A mutase-associated GTPase MeaB [candidate division WOR-3 bacterium]